jgi:SAM-dependent methyltransferase
MRQWLDEAERAVVLMPPEQGIAYWPREGANISCLSDMAHLPLPEESFDRILAAHVLESVPDAEALLRELWSVLKPNGRAIFIAPNRRGFWAHSDSTPFGNGRPYSAHQLKTALREQGFLVERTWQALFFPPMQSQMGIKLSEAAEKYAFWALSGLGGVHIMETSKQVYAPIMTKFRGIRNRLVMPMPFPAVNNT